MQALSFYIGNPYSEYQLMHAFLYNFNQCGKYSAQIDSHQEELRREENFTDKKKNYLFHPYRITIKILILFQVMVK